MPRVIITEGAAKGLEHCRLFLAQKKPTAAKRAAQAIKHQFKLLETKPEIGRPFEEVSEFRELIIPFGDSGYIALYHHVIKSNSIFILAFRHQKEVGYLA